MKKLQTSVGTGIYLPKQILDNDELGKRGIVLPSGKILTSEQIREKIGVERRHIAGTNDTVVEMGKKAAKKALSEKKGVDLILVSTSHPTKTNTAEALRDSLKLKNAKVMDIHNACTGSALCFAYLYDHYKELTGKQILIVAAERFSRTAVDLSHKDAMRLDHSLGQTIFGDGAAALSFTLGKNLRIHYSQSIPLPDPNGKTDLIHMAMGDNSFIEPCIVYPVASSQRPADFPDGYFTQDGPAVYSVIKNSVPAIIRGTVKKAGFSTPDIDLVVTHSGSKRMVDALRDSLEPDFTLYSDYQNGNMSSVSLLYSFIKALQEGKIGRGSIVVLSGFGAGSPHLYSSTAVIELI